MPSCMAFPSSTLMDSPRSAAGKNSRPQSLTILLDLRWPDDLQLHQDQPISDVPTLLPSSLSRWLERERHPGSHALGTGLRTGADRRLTTPKRGAHRVVRREGMYVIAR